jgi:hypothetical protein
MHHVDIDRTPRPPDVGTAYSRKPSTHDAALTEVGRGTPMGELMRRYWHPVGLAADAAHKGKVRQPWYPVAERYGLMFAYMGPPGEEAGDAALRVSGDAGRGRIHRCRRQQHRQRR